jgi:hypothetical protein
MMLCDCSVIGRTSKTPFAHRPPTVGLTMRDPRPGFVWSLKRMRLRLAYCDYMESSEWFTLRERWAENWRATHGIEPCCAICGARWTLQHGDLHHRSYAHLGHEEDADLVALCRTCHGALHRVFESDRSWRRLGRVQATDLIIKALRRKHLGRDPWCTSQGLRR